MSYYWRDKATEVALQATEIDLKENEKELHQFKESYQRTYTQVDFIIIRGLQQERKRLQDEHSRWTHRKNFSLHRRSKEGAL